MSTERFTYTFRGRWNQNGPTGASYGELSVEQSPWSPTDIHLRVGCQHGCIDAVAAIEFARALLRGVQQIRPLLPDFGIRLTARDSIIAGIDTVPSAHDAPDPNMPSWWFPYATQIRAHKDTHFCVCNSDGIIITGPHKWANFNVEFIRNEFNIPELEVASA